MKMEKKYPLKIRLTVGICVPLFAILIALIFFYIGKTPPCIFFEVTGLYCAGCGAGRAFLSLLRGNFFTAFRCNPLMLILSPLVAYYLLKVYISFVFKKDILPFPKIRGRWLGITLLVAIVAFWILRNVPVVPFSYLAPPII